MSSNTALVSGQGSGIGWQVNIPSFGSLALNLGVGALKQLATAGVSEHTLQCMLMIAEVCPATNEYRKEISMCREEQRKTAIWIHKVVELGAATNFVADELLKSRAGENVVALMSALQPVMSEESSDAVILELFTASGASSVTTPGFSQLRSLRTILASLSRTTVFKDKVFQYHSLLKRLLGDDKSLDSTSLADVYNSIPSEETTVHIILVLSELVQEDDRRVLAYHGLKGAAWTIAYARHILGLPVCVLRTTVDQVPINGDYGTARVLVYIFDEESRCDILIQGKVKDFFDVKGLGHEEQYGWTIDTNKTNLLDCYLPASELIRTMAVDIVTSLVHNYTEFLARHIYRQYEDRKLEKIGLVKYSVYCLPAIRQRASRILAQLGFGSHPESKAEPGDWRQYLTIRTSELAESNEEREQERERLEWCDPGWYIFHMVPGPAWLSTPLRQPKTRCGTQSPQGTWEDSRLPNIPEVLEFSDDEMGHIGFLLRIAVAASWLAFTNWDRNLRTISVEFLESRDFWIGWLNLTAPLTAMLSDGQDINNTTSSYGPREKGLKGIKILDKPHKSASIYISDLITVTTNISFDGILGWDSRFDNDSVLATHHRGYIVAQNPAIQQALDMEASFVFFLPGVISANGERRENIYSASTRDGLITLEQRSVNHYHPTNMFPTLKLSSHARFPRDDIALYQEVLIKDQLVLESPLSHVSKALGELYVTNGCDHSYYNGFRPAQSENFESQGRQIKTVKQGLFGIESLKDNPDKATITCYFQAVDQNTCGQWVACGLAVSHTTLSILQRSTCLQCTCEMTEQGHHLLPYARRGTVCVIPGRLEGEPMD